MKIINGKAYTTCSHCGYETQFSRGAVLKDTKFVCRTCAYKTFHTQINYYVEEYYDSMGEVKPDRDNLSLR